MLVMEARFDGNSELVAELVTVNGFKAAYAIKDGAEGPRGWMVFLSLSKSIGLMLITFVSSFLSQLVHSLTWIGIL